MEFLVHNISHSDLLVELSWVRDEPKDSYTDTKTDGASVMTPLSLSFTENGVAPIEPSQTDTPPLAPQMVTIEDTKVPLQLLARPKFSLFQPISQQIMDKLVELRAVETQTSCPDSPIIRPVSLQIDSTSTKGRAKRVRWKARCHDTQSPIGFNLHESPIPVADMNAFRLRGGLDTIELVQKHWRRIAITAVYFPLIALLLPKWVQVLKEFQSEHSQQHIYFISGAGVPHNINHSIQGNSTEITGQLLTTFVQQYYPGIIVHQVHSGSNIFRFDDNVQFMTRELRPRIEAHRKTIVERSGEAWKSHFHVTIAYADGPPARLSALNASLRLFQPSYLHVWQLKTFWHERKLSMDDVDFHAFENIEASPCVSVHHADPMVQHVSQEMRIFRDQFLQSEMAGEVGSFWLRKSRKPVLAVLLVEKQDEHGRKHLVAYRGMNCEVSMPTGSLCAERNAIGSALASDPTLCRRSLQMIGVLGLNLNANNSTPSTKKTTPDSSPFTQSKDSVASLFLSPSTGTIKRPGEKNQNLSTPRKPKRPRTFSCDDASLEALLQPDEVDRNPLAPCGACKEWLIKIAEANPSFRVLTFENARCRNVYINQLM